jgi:MFS transporter
VGLVVVFAFSIGLGVGTVTIPLLALAAGYDAPAVGFLVATAAAMQLGTRLTLPWLLGRFTDRSLTAISAAMMLAAFVLLVASTTVVVFVTAQLLQGAARAIFWTSSQAHAIRDQPEPIRRLVDLNVAGNAGTLVGPAVGGLLASIGLTVALVAGAAGALLAVAGTSLLRAFPPFDRRRSAGTRRLLRRTGVDVACWASVVGGLWWSMMGSFVPVLLVGAGVGSIGVGWAITASEGAGMVALLAQRSVSRARIGVAVRVGAVVAAAALVAIALLPTVLPVAIVLLLVGGAAAGSVTTLSPAMATLVATPDEQGDALSLTGTFRAAALFASPAAVGALVVPLAVGPAMALVALVVGAAGGIVGRGRA